MGPCMLGLLNVHAFRILHLKKMRWVKQTVTTALNLQYIKVTSIDNIKLERFRTCLTGYKALLM